MRADPSSPMVSSQPALGSLTLVSTKGKGDLQSLPINSARVSIGRSEECDVRLYFLDVSKLHGEILFDDSGKATLHIHGSNGMMVGRQGDQPMFRASGSAISLSDGDTLSLRKRLFRFNYEPDRPTSIISTPKRRSSHRLSIVPADKTFTPRTHTPNRPSELEEDAVNVVEGEGGDKLYVEVETETKEQEPPSTPTPSSTIRPSAQVALTTPGKTDSLRKGLLLKSARKVWKDSQSPGIDGAIEEGNVQLRRRSRGSPRIQSFEREEEEPEEIEEVEEIEGVEEVEEVEEVEGIEEVETDEAIEEVAQEDDTNSLEEADAMEVGPVEQTPIPGHEDHLVDQDGAEHVFHEQAEESCSAAYAVEEDEDLDQASHLEGANDQTGASSPPLPGTPAAKHLLQRYYTPQPRRALGAFSLLHTVGRPSRAKPATDAERLLAENVVKIKEEAASEQMDIVMTPNRRLRREKAKLRRQSLAIPRALPIPSSCRPVPTLQVELDMDTATPVVARGSLFPTVLSIETSHSKDETDDASFVQTPIKSIRQRLEALRQNTPSMSNLGKNKSQSLQPSVTPMSKGVGVADNASHTGLRSDRPTPASERSVPNDRRRSASPQTPRPMTVYTPSIPTTPTGQTENVPETPTSISSCIHVSTNETITPSPGDSSSSDTIPVEVQSHVEETELNFEEQHGETHVLKTSEVVEEDIAMNIPTESEEMVEDSKPEISKIPRPRNLGRRAAPSSEPDTTSRPPKKARGVKSKTDAVLTAQTQEQISEPNDLDVISVETSKSRRKRDIDNEKGLVDADPPTRATRRKKEVEDKENKEEQPAPRVKRAAAKKAIEALAETGRASVSTRSTRSRR